MSCVPWDTPFRVSILFLECPPNVGKIIPTESGHSCLSRRQRLTVELCGAGHSSLRQVLREAFQALRPALDHTHLQHRVANRDRLEVSPDRFACPATAKRALFAGLAALLITAPAFAKDGRIGGHNT